MKRKKLILLLALAMVFMLVPMMGVGADNGNDCECEPFMEVDLIAGQNMVVGTVTVTNDDEQVCVTYALDIDALKEGWRIYETHLYIGADDGFPLTKTNKRLGDPYNANPIPGQFPYGDDELNGVKEWSFCISLEDLGVDFCDEVYIAAHAVVKRTIRNAANATIYGNIGGYDGGQGNIYEIDPIDRSETLIFTCPASVSFEANWYPNALAYDEVNRRLYFTTGSNTLMFYDFSSDNEASALTNAGGPFTNSNDVLGATFADGAYWYILNQTSMLYRVDLNSAGMVTERTAYNMPTDGKKISQGDIVYEDGMIFGSSGTGAGGGDNLKGFFSYDISNNEFKVIWEGDALFAAPQLAWGLDADGNKVLYGTLGGLQQTIWTIDTATGDMTPVTTSSESDEPFVTDNRYQDLASSVSYSETSESQTAWGNGDRFNEKGNWGMWFKYKICDPTEIIIYPVSGTTTVAYEDLPIGSSDWDYNDWVATIETKATIWKMGSDSYLTKMEFDITPKARGAEAQHVFGIKLPANTFSVDGTYTLVILDGGGNEVSTASGAFDADAGKNFIIFPQTSAALPHMSNTNMAYDKVEPSRTAKLSIVFGGDGCGDFDLADHAVIGIHGQGLFFEPYINSDRVVEDIGIGDIRMLVVPDDWKWPTEKTRIWNAYNEVGVENGLPTFIPLWWNLGFDENLVYTK